MIGASNLAGERIPFFERAYVPKSSGIFEGAVVVATTTSGDNLEVDLPNSASALNGGRNYVGINASQGSTIVSPTTLPNDTQITVQKAGVAKCALKANTACEKYSPAGYSPADGGYIVPHVSGKTIQIGRFTQSKSSSSASQMVGVWLDEGGSLGEQLVGAIVASSTVITNTAVETAFDQKVTIPAGLLSVGAVLRIFAKARVASGNSTDTLTLKLKIGSQVLVTSAAVDVTDGGGDLGVLFAEVTIRTLGASGSAVAGGYSGLGVPGTATLRVGGVAAAFTLNTTTDLDVTATATWSVASTSNQVLLENLDVFQARQAA